MGTLNTVQHRPASTSSLCCSEDDQFVCNQIKSEATITFVNLRKILAKMSILVAGTSTRGQGQGGGVEILR